MPMLRATRMLNALETGSMTSTQLERLITEDPGRNSDLDVLLGNPATRSRIFSSATASSTIAGSSTAVNKLASFTQDKFKTIFENSGFYSMLDSTEFKGILRLSDTALSALYSTPEAIQVIRRHPSYTKYTSNVTDGTRVASIPSSNSILVGFSTSDNTDPQTIILTLGRLASSLLPIAHTAVTASLGVFPSLANTEALGTFIFPLDNTTIHTTTTDTTSTPHYYGVLRCDI